MLVWRHGLKERSAKPFDPHMFILLFGIFWQYNVGEHMKWASHITYVGIEPGHSA